MTDLDNVPPSVRLGEVVPPEDPEDWGRPLTWVVAASMLAAPIIGAGWFIAAQPGDPLDVVTGISSLAAVVAGSAAITGSTQRGSRRALFATIGAGLFSALGVVLAGTVVAGGVALATAALAAVAGVIGTVPAGALAALVADGASRVRRIVSPTVVGALTAVIVVRLLTSL